MDIKIINVERNFPTFSELHYGDVFMPVGDNVIYMKGKMQANDKTKAIRLADGFIFDFDSSRAVRICNSTLNVSIEKI
jgi:hypothetical protein